MIVVEFNILMFFRVIKRNNVFILIINNVEASEIDDISSSDEHAGFTFGIESERFFGNLETSILIDDNLALNLTQRCKFVTHKIASENNKRFVILDNLC